MKAVLDDVEEKLENGSLESTVEMVLQRLRREAETLSGDSFQQPSMSRRNSVGAPGPAAADAHTLVLSKAGSLDEVVPFDEGHGPASLPFSEEPPMVLSEL